MKVIALLIIAAAFAAAVIIFAWHKGAFLPGWIIWEERALVLEDAALPSEIRLEDRRVEVYRDDALVWESPDNVLVQDFLWCDIDHDNACELMLLCWRIGRYGNAKPFWVEEDEYAWSQHIYIYDWRDNEMHAAWMASDIGMDAVKWRFDASVRLVITETSGRQTGWDWISWGLSLIRE